jgi:hypothetical protein
MGLLSIIFLAVGWLSNHITNELPILTTAVIVGRDGNCGPIYYQQQQVNRHGAYYANYCSDGDDVINRWKEELKRVSLLLGRAIAAKGYFGPVGIDFFVYHDRFGKERLASAIDINARFTMGLMAQMLRKCFAPGKEILFRFISKKKCCLPETISAWKE